MPLFKELQRRNVVRVGIAYLAAAWLLLQVLDLVLPYFVLPAWIMQIALVASAIGFPIALLFAWAYEITPEGIERESDIELPAAPKSRRRQDRVIIAILAAAVILLLVDELVLDNRAPLDEKIRKSVAVLPFVSMSDGQDDEYFADGLSEEILNSLAQFPELFVTSRTASFFYRGKNSPIAEIAAALGVDHIVEGSVRRSGDTLRITAQLIRASDGFHLWSETYDELDEDTFRVQTDVAENIASALNVILDPARREKMLERGWRNPQSYIAYQKAWEAEAKAHGTIIANEAWSDFIELQSDYGLAYQRRADYYLHNVAYEVFALDGTEAGAEEELVQAKANLELAVQFAHTDGHRLSAKIELALVSGEFDRLPELVEAAVTTGECGSPGWWSELIALMSPDLDLQMTKFELACHPMSPWARRTAGMAMARKGETGKAVEILQQAVERTEPVDVDAAWLLVKALLADGKMEEAESIFDRYMGSSDKSLTLMAARGEREKVVAGYARKLEQGRNIDSPMYARVGDIEAANREAAKVDLLPAGPYLLLKDVSDCFCGAPFDIAVTPEFARLVEEAQIPWPPPSPIDWPLKDWP